MELPWVQRQIQRGSTRQTTKTEKLRQMSLCYPIEQAFIVYVYNYYFFIIFTTFILLGFFISLFIMFSFPHFISLFNCIV